MHRKKNRIKLIKIFTELISETQINCLVLGHGLIYMYIFFLFFSTFFCCIKQKARKYVSLKDKLIRET